MMVARSKSLKGQFSTVLTYSPFCKYEDTTIELLMQLNIQKYLKKNLGYSVVPKQQQSYKLWLQLCKKKNQ